MAQPTHESSRVLSSGLEVTIVRRPRTSSCNKVIDGAGAKGCSVAPPAAVVELTTTVASGEVGPLRKRYGDDGVKLLRTLRRGTRAGKNVRRSNILKDLNDYPLSHVVIQNIKNVAGEICLGKELNVESYRVFARKFEDACDLSETIHFREPCEDVVWSDDSDAWRYTTHVSVDRMSVTRTFKLNGALSTSLASAAYRAVSLREAAIDEMLNSLYLEHTPGNIERRNIHNANIDYEPESWWSRLGERIYYGSAANWNWLVGKRLAVPTAPLH